MTHDVPDVWSTTSVAEVEADARMVVGPDEPFDGRSQADMEEAHWAFSPRSSAGRGSSSTGSSCAACRTMSC